MQVCYFYKADPEGPLHMYIGRPNYRAFKTATIAKEEGLASLWKGIVPGLHRQCLYGGLRIGLYEPVGFKIIAGKGDGLTYQLLYCGFASFASVVSSLILEGANKSYLLTKTNIIILI